MEGKEKCDPGTQHPGIDERSKDKNYDAYMREELERYTTFHPSGKTPIISNENVEPQTPGDVDLYATLRDAELEFEELC